MANIKDAFQYASQNPDSDFAKNLSQLAASGSLNEEASKYGIDLSGFQPKPVEKKPSFGGEVVRGVLRPVAKTLLSLQNTGEAIAGQPVTQQAPETPLTKYIEQDGKGAIKRVGSTFDPAHGLDAANSQAIKDAVGTGAELASNFAGGGAAADVAEAGIKQGVKRAVVAGAKEGATVGATQGFGSALEQNKGIGGTIASTLGGAATGALAGAATGVASGAITSIKNGVANKGFNKSNTLFDKTVEDVMPLQKKDVRIDELRNSLPGGSEGGVNRKGTLGKSTPQASSKDLEVAATAHPYVSVTKDPVKKIQNVNKAIIDNSTSIDSVLDSNPTNANFDDMKTYMERNKPTANLQKDPGAPEAYSRATDSALETLANTLKSSTSPEVSGAEIRQARIKIDKEIANQLGETIFNSPQYRGIKAAEIDSRNLLNRMNEDLLRYPGQLDKVNKMNEFIDAARSRGIEVDIKNPEVRSTLEKQFDLLVTPESESAAKELSNGHNTLSNLYTARDNMIDKYQSKVGQNRVGEWIKNNPKLAKALGYIAGGTVLGKVTGVIGGKE